MTQIPAQKQLRDGGFALTLVGKWHAPPGREDMAGGSLVARVYRWDSSLLLLPILSPPLSLQCETPPASGWSSVIFLIGPSQTSPKVYVTNILNVDKLTVKLAITVGV